MKQITLIMFFTLSLFTACAPSPDEPVGSDDPPAAPQTGNYIPSPADGALLRDQVFLEVTGLATLESYPVQFLLQLKGSLPTPCHQLRIAVSPPDAESKVNVEVYSVTDPDKMCIQVLAPFEVGFPLGSFPPGTYSLWVNGEKAADFQS